MKELVYIRDELSIIVDGERLEGLFTAPESCQQSLHTLVWTDFVKEYTTENQGSFKTFKLTDSCFDLLVTPLLEQWQEAKKTQEEQFRVDRLSYTEKFTEGLITEEAYAEAIRNERNTKISELENSNEYKKTQRLALLGDTTAITELEKFEEQIQTLREIPQMEGFPRSFQGF